VEGRHDLDGHRGLDRRVGIVAEDANVLGLEREEVASFGVELDGR
jgi:hypothetical protein